MALHFSTASEESLSNGIKVLVYGGAGVGKTVLTATLPTPVLISAESGALSLRESNLRRLFGNDQSVCYNMPIITIETADDLRDAHLWCLQSAEARNFQSIGLDSITEIGEVVLNNAKRQVKDPRQAYGELIEKMETLIRAFRDLQGKNVLVSAKMEPTKDELSGIVKYGPSMPGAKLGPKLPTSLTKSFVLGLGKIQRLSRSFVSCRRNLTFNSKQRIEVEL